MWDYTEKVKDHFLNPRNVGVIEDADAVGEVGSLACGDALTLYLKLDADKRITDARFQTFGCASAIASSSALTEMVKGKTLEEAREITNENIADFLGGLPKEKIHCSVMGRDALDKAISCYLGEEKAAPEGEIVCECFGVTDHQIRHAVTDHHLKSIEEVTGHLKAGGACGNLPREDSGHHQRQPRASQTGKEAAGHDQPAKNPPHRRGAGRANSTGPETGRRRHSTGGRGRQPGPGQAAGCLRHLRPVPGNPEKLRGGRASRYGSARTGGRGGQPMNTVYLDNNATTRVAPEVVEAMMPYFSELYGNPSSMHRFGGNVAAAVREAREQVAALLGAAPEEIVLTSCGTESDSTAIRSALGANPDKRHVITSQVEHPAVKNLGEALVAEGYRVTFVPVDRQGRLDLDYLKRHLTDDTAVGSFMWANNETGVIFPMEEIAGIFKEKGVLLHTDAVQAAGKIPMDMARIPVDMLSLSGHKLHGPKGIGVLYLRKGTPFRPFLLGGHQEGGRRAGTENTASIIGLGKACELARQHLEAENTRVRGLRDRLEAGLLQAVPGATVNGEGQDRLPNTTSIAFDSVEGEAILLMMDEFGICASSGSACTSGSLEPSHVLRAMNVPFTSAHGSIRFSLSIYNTDADVDRVLEKLPPIIARLREMSPFWKGGACAAAFSQ